MTFQSGAFYIAVLVGLSYHFKMNAILEICLVMVLPVLIWVSGVISLRYREWALTAMVLMLGYVIYLNHWSWEKLGFRLDNFQESLLPYTIVLALALIFIGLFGRANGRRFIPSWREHQKVLFWVTLGSIFQEFAYRGYLMPKLMEVNDNIFFVLILNTVLYGLVHITYPEAKSNMLLITLGGLMFATIYWYYPNLILISVLHMILNFVACSFGFFTFKPKAHEKEAH